MSSPIDAINALRAKYDAQETGNALPAAYGQQAQQSPAPNTFGSDGTNFSKELSKEQAQQTPKANDGSGAMWAGFGINLGLSILGKIFGKGGGEGGGGGDEEQQQAGGCSSGGGGG